MTSHYQNQTYQQESAPTEYLHQNLGFSPVYEQQQRVPPYGPPYQTTSDQEYLREPPIGRPPAPYYPTPLPDHQQPQPLFVISTHDDALAHPVPAYGQQQQVPPCPGDVTAPYYNPNSLPPPPPQPTPRPRVYAWNCSSFKMNCLYLLLLTIGIGVPLYYYYR